MGNKSKKTAASSITPTPIAPWIYINDPKDGIPHIGLLHTMLPISTIIYRNSSNSKKPSLADLLLTNLTSTNEIPLIAEQYSESSDDTSKKLATATALRDASIKRGCNFVSVNIRDDQTVGAGINNLVKYGANHLEVKARGDDEESQRAVAEEIYRWLCKYTLHCTP